MKTVPGKRVKVYRWRIPRSQIRHRGFWHWLHMKWVYRG